MIINGYYFRDEDICVKRHSYRKFHLFKVFNGKKFFQPYTEKIYKLKPNEIFNECIYPHSRNFYKKCKSIIVKYYNEVKQGCTYSETFELRYLKNNIKFLDRVLSHYDKLYM